VNKQLDIQFGEADGRPLKLDALAPTHVDGPFLTVLWLHGGGWQSGNKRNAIDGHLLDYLVSSGYLIVSAEYRLSSEATYPAQIHDVKAAIRWLRAESHVLDVDVDRIVVAGFSAGAHLTALAATPESVPALEGNCGSAGFPSNVCAAIAWAAPTDFLRNPAVEDTALNALIGEGDVSGEEKLLGGPVRENPDLAQLANPCAFASPDGPPVLVIHGTRDEVVPVSQADLLVDACEAAKTSVSYLRIRHGNHGGWRTGTPYPSDPGPREIEDWIVRFLDRCCRNKGDLGIMGRRTIAAPIPA